MICVDEKNSQVIDFTFQESTAKQTVALLTKHGVRARYECRARYTIEEPYVEHFYAVIVDYVHDQELSCAKRILCLPMPY